jgi:hypothetical protein
MAGSRRRLGTRGHYLANLAGQAHRRDVFGGIGAQRGAEVLDQIGKPTTRFGQVDGHRPWRGLGDPSRYLAVDLDPAASHDDRDAPPRAWLLLLCVTLFLVLQVMRPQAVSFTDVQASRKHSGPFGSALGKWREIVESHQDLYLPCGVKSLTSLRQSMIIEKITLMALAQAKEGQEHRGMRKQLEGAQEARVLRLHELRDASAQVATIGEYYKLRSRSTRATYGGILCTLTGMSAIIAAFTWPLT